MAKGDIHLGPLGAATLLSPIGLTFDEGEIQGTRQERTASGKLRKEIMWSKMAFTLDYSDAIDGDILDGLKDLYDLQENLTMTVHYTDTKIKTYTVSMKPFKRKWLILTGNQLWTGTSIELEEV